ncbi:hypothetical protein KGA66_13235 [Actinocrinis puniceicyclus]|uniref:DUF6760 domain-containing protein n=1 Tax=Actinocrinis puniceicyclus TaxID=977794 RepID=A0A8J8BER3_9ACTN|nr:DUF6760 family protein [Actinocrinis puniceicyclus]MBS2964014.1 hypothetical protein [Actinocrinis puniceicyclus]
MTYGTDLLLEEVSYVAYHFHWPLETILDLEHPLRRDFVARIGAINAAVNEAAEERARTAAGAGPDADAAGNGW